MSTTNKKSKKRKTELQEEPIAQTSTQLIENIDIMGDSSLPLPNSIMTSSLTDTTTTMITTTKPLPNMEIEHTKSPTPYSEDPSTYTSSHDHMQEAQVENTETESVDMVQGDKTQIRTYS